MAPSEPQASKADSAQVLHAAKARCQCTGQCGFTHAWTAEASARPCAAPQGCAIVRKIDYPSYWQLAASEWLPLEHPEHYNVEKPVLVELHVATLPGGTVIAACQRCKLLIEEATGTGKKRRRRDA